MRGVRQDVQDQEESLLPRPGPLPGEMAVQVRHLRVEMHDKQNSQHSQGKPKAYRVFKRLPYQFGDVIFSFQAKEHSVLITCTLCNKSFSSDSNLNAHTKVVHGLYTGANGEAVAPPEFACEFCGLTFKSRTYFGTHLAQHRGETDERVCV